MSTGYHKVAEIMMAHREMAVVESFEYLNTLNLLFMQADLSNLEETVRKALGEPRGGKGPGSEETEDEKNNRNGLEIERVDRSDQNVGEQGVFDEESDERDPVDMGESCDEDKTAVASLGSFRDFSGDISEYASNDNDTDDSDLMLRGNDPKRDWFFLSRMKSSRPIWDTMLEVREKLQVYNTAILRLKDVYAQPSPSRTTHSFLTHWFRSESLGNKPLMGVDRKIYLKRRNRSSLIALSPTDCPDPLSRIFLQKFQLAYHYILGSRFYNPHCPKIRDEETNQNGKYFVYDDRRFLRAADVVGSLISSCWLVASIVILYYIENMGARLAITAVFTTGFGLVLSLLTRSRKVEVFIGCATFAAVQVVFVSNIKN